MIANPTPHRKPAEHQSGVFGKTETKDVILTGKIRVEIRLTKDQAELIDRQPGTNGRAAKIIDALAQTIGPDWPQSPERGQHIRKPKPVQPAPESKD